MKLLLVLIPIVVSVTGIFCNEDIKTSKCKSTDPAFLLFTNQEDIRKISLDSLDVSILANNTKYATVLDFHYRNNMLFYGDTILDKLYKMPMNGSGEEMVIQQDVELSGLAIDWMYDHIYWSDNIKKTICVSDLDGNLKKSLIYAWPETPKRLVIDPSRGWLFWIGMLLDGQYHISRAGANGLKRKIIVNNFERYDYPNDLTLDITEARIYWVDLMRHSVYSCDYDGQRKRIILHSENLFQHTVSINIFEDWLYWWNRETKFFYKADKLSGENKRAVFTVEKAETPKKIQIYHSSKQIDDVNYCKLSKCSHLCLAAPQKDSNSSKVSCECPPGFLFADDHSTCIERQRINIFEDDIEISLDVDFRKKHRNSFTAESKEGTLSLLLANDKDVRTVSLNAMEMTLIVNESNYAAFVDYHYRNKEIYWSEFWGGIFKVPIEKTNYVTFVRSDANLCGLAIDWIYNHIYWIDCGEGTINVANIVGTTKKTLLRIDPDTPTNIAVDPLRGWMFWAATNLTHAKIERAGMDGSYRETILVINTSLPTPFGFTLDLAQARIYWVDPTRYTISSCDYNGQRERVVLRSDLWLTQTYYIDVFDSSIYWFEKDQRTVFSANKYNGQFESIIPVSLDAEQLRIYHPSKQPNGTNYCTVFSNRCSYLCLPAPQIDSKSSKISCACPDGFSLLDDGKTCVLEQDLDRVINPYIAAVKSKDSISLQRQFIAQLKRIDCHIVMLILIFAATAGVIIMLLTVMVFIYHQHFYYGVTKIDIKNVKHDISCKNGSDGETCSRNEKDDDIIRNVEA